jgi:DNA-3-methyladenine glycosylase
MFDVSAPGPLKRPLTPAFFDRDAELVARDLLGKVIRHRLGDLWLSARIIETEAYKLEDRGSHASLGETPSRRALFMAGGTVYMYYARGGDSLNLGAAGPGNAVLIKSGFPVTDAISGAASLARMLELNPTAAGQPRAIERLCAGQTLLCRALGLKVPDWNARQLDPQHLFVDDDGYRPERILRTTRLGIPPGRDEHLPYRFVDAHHARFCTRNPLGRTRREGEHYHYVSGR